MHALVQIVGPSDQWILERLARKLAAKLPYAEFVAGTPRPTAATRLVYYVNYALYQGPSGLIDVGLFTHDDPAHQYLQRARQIDFCVCMSRTYAEQLQAQGVAHVPMGFDAYRYRPRLVLGVIGLLDHPRKGKHLVEHLRQLPFVEIVATEGRLPDAELCQLYQRIDYVLIPATIEGGPMSLLEGLGMGKPVIAPDGVGMVPEFGDAEHIRRYPAGDADGLARVVRTCYEEKRQGARLVEDRSWDHWAQAHHRFFVDLLKQRGHATPAAAPGFRFGLLRGLDLPWDVDLEPLEAAVDRAAGHLFHGRSSQARTALSEALPRFPCVQPLLASLA